MTSKLTNGLLILIVVLQTVVLARQSDEVYKIESVDRWLGIHDDTIREQIDFVSDEIAITQTNLVEAQATLDLMQSYGVRCDPISLELR